MEDIYDNLENYNEVNVVEELKNENKELKSKLQEYSNAMNQLQTDFDKLNSEYKKLEMNYSSLLKTARAEIERKTQMISNLNKEKDMLVISSIQKGHKNILNNLNRGKYNKKEIEKRDGDKNLANGNKNKSGPKKLNVSEGLRSIKCEAVLAPPKSSPSSEGTAKKSASIEIQNKNTPDKHCSDSKENVLKSASVQPQNDNKDKSMKIMDRRKSMPVLSNWDELSSEEEINDYGESKHNSNRNHHHEIKNHNDQYGRKSCKTSEHSSYESCNNYSNERYMDSYNPYQRDIHLDVQRNADYQTRSHSQIYPRHSSERDRYKPHRMYNHSQRLDYTQRVSESPPLDKYKRSKSRERKYQNRDYQRDYNDYNKNKRDEHHPDERDFSKEPDYKRRKIESTSTDTERIDRCIDRKSFKHSGYSSSLKPENYTSCQSPDYDQFEPTPTTHHFVKEIKDTATVQLDDPRITSKKYLLKKTADGNFITRADKNFRMVPIDKIKWGIEKIAVPEALKEHPSTATINDDLIKNIYMDIEIPSLNIEECNKNFRMVPIDKLKWGVEKIAVPEALKEHPSTATINDDLIKNIYMDIDIPTLNIEECNKNEIIEDKSHMPSSSDTSEVTRHKENTSNLKDRDDLKTHPRTFKANDETPKTLSIHYKIPRKSNADSKGIKSNKNVDEDIKKGDGRLEKACNIQSENMGGDENNYSTKLKNQVQRLAPIKDNVEGDLELSDEASDVTDDIHVDDGKVKVNIVHDKIHDIKCKEIDNHKYKKTANENIKVDESKNKSSDSSTNDQARNKDATNKIDISEEFCEEKTTKQEDEYNNTLSKIDTIEKNIEDNKSCISRKCKEEIKVTAPKNINECKKKIIKKGFQEETAKLNECKVSKSQTKHTSKREKRKRSSKSDPDKSLQDSQIHTENLDSYTKTQPKDSQTKNKFTELFGESSSLITPHDLGISTKFEINASQNDKYGSLFENTQDAIDFNVRDIQEKLNTDKNTTDGLCSESVPVEEEPVQTCTYIDKKPIFQIEEKHSANGIFKNLKPADSENESNIVKTVVISSGTQLSIEEKDQRENDLPKSECNNEKERVANQQLSLELLEAVATSTPNKMHLEVPSRSSEVNLVPSNESLSKNNDISVSNMTPTSTTAPDSNAPDVRIFLKRRRKIIKNVTVL